MLVSHDQVGGSALVDELLQRLRDIDRRQAQAVALAAQLQRESVAERTVGLPLQRLVELHRQAGPVGTAAC